MFEYAWLLFAFPIASALLILFFGKWMPRAVVGWIASLAILGAFGVAVGLTVQLFQRPIEDQQITIQYWEWIRIGALSIPAAILVDPLSVTMALVVTGIGGLIHIYSIGYMDHEERYQRFFFYMNFFILAMLILVMSNNVVLTFVGWEGVGLASYLLIGFWFDKHDEQYGWYADCGKKAFLVNRIGDAAYLIAIFLIWTTLGTFLYEAIDANAATIPAPTALVIVLLLLFAVSGKSAQIPLYVWLPDAMAGPTPVSALIHAATMVTAGVYLIVRTYALWDLVGAAATVVGWIGILTAFFAATLAIVQTDLKKILAYSTISQLGYMVAAAGVGAFGAAIFILVAHAFFKAVLFLGAGSVMHATDGVIDVRRLGGLRHKMPHTYLTFLIGAMALGGIPLLSGFWAKDAVLTGFVVEDFWPIFAVAAVTALLTGIYSFRAVFLTFNGKPRDQHVYDHAHESKAIMVVPLWILAFFSVFIGLINTPFALQLEQFLEPAIHPHSEAELMDELVVTAVSVVVSMLGLFYAWARYIRHEHWTESVANAFNWIKPALDNKWYVDRVYDAVIVRPLNAVAAWLARVFDPKIIDGAVNAVGSVTLDAGAAVRKIQNGAVPTYAFAILLGVVSLLAYFLWAM
ncbi:MAG: NADH-quinone oxidoreductase subunit L [Anaerolineales bacterium]|nr:NADH-quinone oxidoreductase subunit L [Anaerolineales bacterium]